MTLEGYDVIAYGAVLPYMLSDSSWGLTIAQAGVLGSLTPVGMLAGAIAVGLLTDIVGRRRLVIASLIVFSSAMILCAVAPSVSIFAIGRALVGLGVGGVLPSIAALVFEFSAPSRRNRNTALAFTGAGLGGVLAATVAAVVVPEAGFRTEFLLGGLGALVVAPVALRYLPESLTYLHAAGRDEEAHRWRERLGLDASFAQPDRSESVTISGHGLGRIAVLFSHPFARTTLLLCSTNFVSLLMLFGVNTWLPQLMRAAGYELGSALTFLIVLNFGTAIGPLLLGAVADRIGSTKAIVGSFVLAAVGIAVLSYPLPIGLLYAAVIVAGVGTLGTQILLNVLVASRYPVQVRATAIGTALSVGRLGGILGPLYGGLLLSAQLPTLWLFYAFAAPALAGVVLVALVPRPAPQQATNTVANTVAEP